MGAPEQAPDNSDDTRQEPDAQDEASEAALMREILRTQEQHREGGVEPELDETNEDPHPET
jgi:hypothetical protein